MPGGDHAQDEQHATDAGRRYLIRFDEDTLRSRPLWMRVIIEFAGPLLLDRGRRAGVINHCTGGHPVSRGRRRDRPWRAGEGPSLTPVSWTTVR